MMRQIPNNKYTIAWFKLAECVAKGEKEKAFGVYRLLMHSIEDRAYASQLEADLFGAFDDDRALEKYGHAAQLYMRENRFKEAAALYEELIKLHPNIAYICNLSDIYFKHKNKTIAVEKLSQLVDLLLEKKSIQLIINVLEKLVTIADESTKSHLYLKITSSFISGNAALKENDEAALEGFLDFLLQNNEEKELQKILFFIEQTNTQWYERACAYLKK